MTKRRFTILGCGSSPGVPRITGEWGACDPNNPRNRRTRASMLVEQFSDDGALTSVVIDTGPDFRSQMIAVGARALNAVVLGISVDAQPAKAAWAQTLGPISFDLLSDFHPQGDVARKFGVFREKDGISERAIFVVDTEGRIAWAKVYDIPQQPGNDEVLAALGNAR